MDLHRLLRVGSMVAGRRVCRARAEDELGGLQAQRRIRDRVEAGNIGQHLRGDAKREQPLPAVLPAEEHHLPGAGEDEHAARRLLRDAHQQPLKRRPHRRIDGVQAAWLSSVRRRLPSAASMRISSVTVPFPGAGQRRPRR